MRVLSELLPAVLIEIRTEDPDWGDTCELMVWLGDRRSDTKAMRDSGLAAAFEVANERLVHGEELPANSDRLVAFLESCPDVPIEEETWGRAVLNAWKVPSVSFNDEDLNALRSNSDAAGTMANI